MLHFRVEIFWSKHRLPNSVLSSLGLPVVKVVHFHRWSSFTGRSDPIETCCYMSKNCRFHFYFAKQVIKLSVKTEWIPSICLVTLSAFHSTKKSGLRFWQRMAQHFPKFLKRGQPCEV